MGKYVSGTNVNATISVTLTRDPTIISVYTKATLVDLEVKIGGEADSTMTPKATPNAPVVPGDPIYHKIRFASTRFKDAKDIDINAKAHYYLTSDDGHTHTKDLYVTLPTLTVTAYNQGLALATKLIASCQPGVGYVPGTGAPASYYDADSQQAVPSAPDGTRAADRLSLDAGQMRHTPLQSRTDPYLKKVPLLLALNKMTAFFAYTHGEVGLFLPSLGSGPGDSVLPEDKLSYANGGISEVGKAVLGVQGDPVTPLRTYPRPNMVVLHACSGLSTGADVFLRGFGLLKQSEYLLQNGLLPPSVVDRAGAGFPYTVAATLHSTTIPAKNHLSDHAKRVYENLLKGMTIGKALEDAHDFFVPARAGCDGTWSRMLMEVRGDKNARLIGVYTNTDAAPTLNSYGNLNWYKVIP